MRLLLALFIVCDISMAAMADETFPYQATIESELANIRSGPASAHYVTNRLSRGDKVEIFRHDPGGWYAIRPPQSEFSLVRAKYILLNPNNGTGQITLDGTRAWVGTRIAAQSEPMWQVQLQRGDVVKVIGKQQVEDAQGGLNAWYEIAPPAGEFRWIHEREFQKPELVSVDNKASVEREETDSLREQSGTLASENGREERQLRPVQQQIEGDRSEETSELATTIRPKPFQPTQIAVESTVARIAERLPAQATVTANPLTSQESRPAIRNEIPGGWQVAGEERSGAQRQVSGGDEPGAVYPVNDSADGFSQMQASDRPVAKNSPPAKLVSADDSPSSGAGNLQTATATDNLLSQNLNQLDQVQGASFADQYRQLELLLTMSILKPADQWQLEPLHRAVREFAKGAIDPDQQMMVSALLHKVESFEKLQQQQQAVNASPAKPDDPRKSSAATGNALQESNIARQEKSSRTFELPIDPSVRPAAFAENQASPENPNQAIEKGAVLAAVEADEIGDSPQAGGAIGTGVSVEPDSIYDGTGWLNLLYTNNGKGRSDYVLQDENGNIIQTILPAPGVNLDRYLKQEVGVMGRRGFNRKYNLPHVTADRVIVLERHR